MSDQHVQKSVHRDDPSVDPEGANQLAVDHLPLVRHLVRETMARVPASVDRDDLHAAGLMALVTASRSYAPDRGVPFRQYATLRIRGALLDELRGMDWASRGVRRRAREVEATRSRLANALGQFPDDEQVASALGIEIAEVRQSDGDVARARVLSLMDESVQTAAALGRVSPGADSLVEQMERVEYLRDAVAELSPRHRRVIEGYFLAEEPMAVMAEELGVSESRISQLRAEALVLLRGALNATLEAEPQAREPGVVPGVVPGVAERRRESYYAAVADRHAARRVRGRGYAGSALDRSA